MLTFTFALRRGGARRPWKPARFVHAAPTASSSRFSLRHAPHSCGDTVGLVDNGGECRSAGSDIEADRPDVSGEVFVEPGLIFRESGSLRGTISPGTHRTWGYALRDQAARSQLELSCSVVRTGVLEVRPSPQSQESKAIHSSGAAPRSASWRGCASLRHGLDRRQCVKRSVSFHSPSVDRFWNPSISAASFSPPSLTLLRP